MYHSSILEAGPDWTELDRTGQDRTGMALAPALPLSLHGMSQFERTRSDYSLAFAASQRSGITHISYLS